MRTIGFERYVLTPTDAAGSYIQRNFVPFRAPMHGVSASPGAVRDAQWWRVTQLQVSVLNSAEKVIEGAKVRVLALQETGSLGMEIPALRDIQALNRPWCAQEEVFTQWGFGWQLFPSLLTAGNVVYTQWCYEVLR